MGRFPRASAASCIALLIMALIGLVLFAASGAPGEEPKEVFEPMPEATAAPLPAPPTPTPEKREQITIGVFSPHDGEYAAGASAFAAKNGARLRIFGGDGTWETQKRQIGEFVEAYGCWGVFLVELCPGANLAEIAELAEAGGTYWSAVGEPQSGVYPMDYRYFAIFQAEDEYAAAEKLAQWMFSRMAEGEGLLIFEGEGAAAARHTEALADALKAREDIAIRGSAMAEHAEDAREQTMAALEQGGVDAIWCGDEAAAVGAAAALRESGQEDVLLVLAESSAANAMRMQNQELHACFYTFGRAAGHVGAAIPYFCALGEMDISRQTSENRYFYVPTEVMTRMNATGLLAKYNGLDERRLDGWRAGPVMLER